MIKDLKGEGVGEGERVGKRSCGKSNKDKIGRDTGGMMNAARRVTRLITVLKQQRYVTTAFLSF